MGTWAAGPFDNDSAADWCGGLADADPAQRPDRIAQALRAVVDEPGYLDSHPASQAVAAATIVAAHLPGGPRIDSAYAPDFLTAGGRLDLPDELVPLAAQALDRVLGADSELVELWSEASDPDEFNRALAPIRAALGGAAS